MNNRKGFTLVELLGAIVVLAILSLIAIPTVTNSVKSSKQKLYDTQIKNIELAARSWGNDNRDKLPEKGKSISITLNKLQNEGYVEKNIKNPKTERKLENLRIIITNKNNKYIYKVDGKINETSVLVTGEAFNLKIKSLTDSKINNYYNGYLIDKMSFYSNGELPQGYTKKELEKLDNESVSEDNKIKAYYDSENKVVYVYSENQIYANEDSSSMFKGFMLLELDITQLYTSNVIDMSQMFSGVSGFTNLNLSNFDTSNVTDMSEMFSWSNFSFSSLDLSSFDTSKVTDMSGMFEGNHIHNITLSSFDTSNVTDMSRMFSNETVPANDIKKLNLSNFDTSNVINMSEMFKGRLGLESLNLSSFDTSNVTNMSSMFERCINLKKLDLTSFDTSSVTNMKYMFNGEGFQNNFEEITVTKGKWVINSNTNTTDIFKDNIGITNVTYK